MTCGATVSLDALVVEATSGKTTWPAGLPWLGKTKSSMAFRSATEIVGSSEPVRISAFSVSGYLGGSGGPSVARSCEPLVIPVARRTDS